MTPKDKAVELCQLFAITTRFSKICNNGVSLPLEIAKQCAIIAVDQIIAAIDFDWMDIQNLDRKKNYWDDVKVEIMNL